MQKFKNLGIFISWVILYLFLNIIGTMFIAGIFNTQDDNKILIINICLQTLFMVIMVLIYRKEISKDFKKIKKDDLITGIRYLVFFTLISLFISLITSFLGSNISENEAANRSFLNTMIFPALFSFLIVAPITEELLFRFSLKKVFTNKWIFIVISGILFGIPHMAIQGITDLASGLQLLNYSIMGSALALIYSETKNIWIPIITHSLNNLLAVLLILLGSIGS